MTALSVTTLEKMRTADNFSLFYKAALNLQEHTGTDSPVMPRKRRAPQYLEVGSSTGYHSLTAEEHYRRYHYEALDNAVSIIKITSTSQGTLCIVTWKIYSPKQQTKKISLPSYRKSLTSTEMI